MILKARSIVTSMCGCMGLSAVSAAPDAGRCDVVLNNESQVWQCVSKQGTCAILVQHAACKLLICGAIGNKDLDDGGQTLLERRKSLPWLLDAVRFWVMFPLGGDSPNTSEHA